MIIVSKLMKCTSTSIIDHTQQECVEKRKKNCPLILIFWI